MKFKTILLLIHQMDSLHIQTTVSPTFRSHHVISIIQQVPYTYSIPFIVSLEPNTVIGYPEEMAGFPSNKPALLWDKFQWTP
jgi:hypothetical protein